MKPPFALLSAALLTALFAAPADAATETLFTENFDGNSSGLWSSGSGIPLFENTGWTYSTVYKALHAIRMGSTSSTGSATTPEIPLKTGWAGATVTVTFQSAAWYGTSSGLTLSKIEDGKTTPIDSWSVPQIADGQEASSEITDLSGFSADSNNKPYSVSFDVYGPFQLVFETTGSGNNRRAYLDSVSVIGEESVAPPTLSSSAVSSSSVTVSWPAQTVAASYAICAWTLVPVNVVEEDFAGYPNPGKPSGWTFTGLSLSAYEDEPVAFNGTKGSEMWMLSPRFDVDVDSVSFLLRANSATASTLVLSGSADGTSWSDIASWTGDDLKGTSVTKTATVQTAGIRYLKWTFNKESGNIFIGSVKVFGAGIGHQVSYLAGYSSEDDVSTASTSVTLTPVPGEKNYIEVSAVGQTGKTATATLAVEVPAAAGSKPVVISVK